MKKKYMAPHMTVEQVKANYSMLTASVRSAGNEISSKGYIAGGLFDNADAKERDGGVWSTDKNNLDWDF